MGESVAKGVLRAIFARLDNWSDRLYGSRLNPLYQTGAIAVLSLAVIAATGVYLLLFYRIGSPFESVVRIAGQPWGGRWIRSLHRYAADVALVAAALHALRMYFQGRSWGPRALAWTSGVVLVGLILVCGWTGYVMVWDAQAQLFATEGARLLDALPIFSERISATFSGSEPLPPAFFFLNLFLHIALPIGIAIFLWVHLARLARPVLLPPPPVLWSTVAILTAVSVLLPAGVGAPADLLSLPGATVVDLFYAFWLPVARTVRPAVFWTGAVGVGLALLSVPLWTRPPRDRSPLPSAVASRLCTACEQCYLDCPYDAIRMVDRTDGRSGQVARVEPSLCVSCGICAGSCAPMGVGPPGRTGRDQLERVGRFIADCPPAGDEIVVVGCRASAAGGSGAAAAGEEPGPWRVLDYPVGCAGNLHTSVVEYLVRAGVGMVVVVACPARDCRNREGPKWLAERLYGEREAELHARVDRGRVRMVHAGAGGFGSLESVLAEIGGELAGRGSAAREGEIEIETACAAGGEEGRSAGPPLPGDR